MIRLKVSGVWKKLGTGRKTKEEILGNVTYVKIFINNFSKERPIKCKMEIYSEKDDGPSGHKENILSKITNDIDEVIDILLQIRTQKIGKKSTKINEEELGEEIFKNEIDVRILISNLIKEGPPRCNLRIKDAWSEEIYLSEITKNINKAINILLQLRKIKKIP